MEKNIAFWKTNIGHVITIITIASSFSYYAARFEEKLKNVTDKVLLIERDLLRIYKTEAASQIVSAQLESVTSRTITLEQLASQLPEIKNDIKWIKEKLEKTSIIK